MLLKPHQRLAVSSGLSVAGFINFLNSFSYLIRSKRPIRGGTHFLDSVGPSAGLPDHRLLLRRSATEVRGAIYRKLISRIFQVLASLAARSRICPPDPIMSCYGDRTRRAVIFLKCDSPLISAPTPLFRRSPAGPHVPA